MAPGNICLSFCESIGQQLVSNGVLRKTSLLLDLEQDLFPFAISNRNMIGGLRSISKNLFAQLSLPSIGIPTMFCWLQVLLDLRSGYTLVTSRILNPSHLQLLGVTKCPLLTCWLSFPIVFMAEVGFTL